MVCAWKNLALLRLKSMLGVAFSDTLKSRFRIWIFLDYTVRRGAGSRIADVA